MAKARVLIFLVGVLIVGILAVIASYYARGYKFNTKTLQFSPNGLLVANSEPTGAQIYVDGVLKTATNATIALSPGTYEVQIKKEGFIAWNKKIVVEKEIVTQVEPFLFPTAGSLSPITFAGAMNPAISDDSTKIVYGVSGSPEDNNTGIWISETLNLPIGFSREPKRITDINPEGAIWIFSPDGRLLMVTIKDGSIFTIDTGNFTPQATLTNLGSAGAKKIKDSWEIQKDKKMKANMERLAPELGQILALKGKNIVFSPDEKKVLYEASAEASIPANLIKQLPGSSSQTQEREIKKGYKYVYDLKEDRNFVVAEPNQIAIWFPTSSHIVLPMKDKVVIEDYDGTNKQTVYSGSYVAPFAFSYLNTSRLIILTNLGSNGNVANLYSLSLR
ncbi:MAG: PEGA domain-containing protein [Patescibacteria group bacterium]